MIHWIKLSELRTPNHEPYTLDLEPKEYMTTEIQDDQELLRSLRVALVHDWLTGMRGGEKCLEVFCEIFPQADIYTLLHIKGSVSPTIETHRIKTSWIQHLPWVERKYRNYLPLFPRAIESFSLKGYDLILSSSHCVAKGIPVPPGALHVAYIHTPMRYVWDLYDVYFGRESTAGRPAKIIMPAIRPFLQKWDVRSNDRVHYFLANSDHVRRRIMRHYNRPAEVIHPPVDTQAFDLSPEPKDYYLLVSALAPYKRVDLAIRAFNRMGKPLVIVGTGPLMTPLQKESGKTISWLGWQPSESLKKLYGECRAFIFPGEEDAGITPLEAQASGRPVVAFGRGGALETVVPLGDYQEGKRDFFSGIFFPEQTEESFSKAIHILENQIHLLEPERVRTHAGTFDRQVFKERITRSLMQKLKERP
ncbi:MAG: glycosyltransferase [Thermodesulfobacteriota bacterium]